MDKYLENSHVLQGMFYRCLFLFSLLVGFYSPVSAQDDDTAIEDSINKIKLSNNYFVAEAYDRSIGKAMKTCYQKLFLDVHLYRASKKMKDLDNMSIEEHIKVLHQVVGDSRRIFAYLDRSFAEQKDTLDKKDIFVTAPVKVIETNKETNKMNIPEVIERLLKTDTYTNADWILSNAKSTGRITDFAKYRQMDDPDSCYLLIIDKEMNVVAVLSPKDEHIRMDVRSGAEADMKQYAGCAAICIKM